MGRLISEFGSRNVTLISLLVTKSGSAGITVTTCHHSHVTHRLEGLLPLLSVLRSLAHESSFKVAYT